MRTALYRTLSRRVSVAAMIEFAMWLAIPYIVIGLAVSFVKAEQVQYIETQLQTRIPAGSEVAAFGLVTLTWPVLLVAPDVCAP
jgi:hypothetical protein